MSNSPGGPARKQNFFNLALVGMMGQVGCLTLVIVLGALFLGLWLDGIFQTRPWITIGLVVVSMPVSVIAMVVLTRMAVDKIKAQTEDKTKDP